MDQPNIIFFGTPDFAVPSLEILIKKGFHVAAVVTAPDRPSGRGLKLQPSPVKKVAMTSGIPVLQPEQLNDPVFVEELSALNPDLQVVVAFRKLPLAVWSMPSLGTFNLHASLLPDYRGAAPIHWAVINGETTTGLTTFLIDENIDTGNILLTREMEIFSDDTTGSLHDRMSVAGAALVAETVDALVQRSITPKAQALIGLEGQEYHLAPKISKADGRVRWDKDVASIYNHIRGMFPFPGAYVCLSDPQGESWQFKIHKAKPEKDPSVHRAGILDTDGKAYVRISGLNGWISIMEWQKEGARPVMIRDFLNGHHHFGSWRVEMECSDQLNAEK